MTDYARHIVMQGPVYGLDTTLTAGEVCGVVSNPMEHGEASKLALYGVADYTWNTADFNASDNWERGIEALTPEAADAYRTFAIHSRHPSRMASFIRICVRFSFILFQF